MELIACFYYLEIARQISEGLDKFIVYNKLKTTLSDFLQSESIPNREIKFLNRLLVDNIHELEADSIFSSGYVVHTLESSIWCLLKTHNYKETTLKAVNLGLDTDTTAAVTSGLAGLLYGYESIPKSWVEQLARNDDKMDLAFMLKNKYENIR